MSNNNAGCILGILGPMLRGLLKVAVGLGVIWAIVLLLDDGPGQPARPADWEETESEIRRDRMNRW